jgi:hypothetical protein
MIRSLVILTVHQTLLEGSNEDRLDRRVEHVDAWDRRGIRMTF